MRRKREQQKQTTVKTDVEKNKNLPGDDKILNILSSTENQGLINNLLGIGKTLGLTGKQNSNVPPPPPPPPPPATETITSNVQTAATITSSSQTVSQTSTAQLPVMNMISSNVMTSSPWNSQQWASQYNAGVPNFPNFQTMTGVPPPPFSMPPIQMPPPNFTQPPPNFPAIPNFSQPPPGFVNNDSRQNHNIRPSIPSNMQQGRPSPFGLNTSGVADGNSIHNERQNQAGPINNFDSGGHISNFSVNDPVRQKGISTERFGSDGINDQQTKQYRCNDMFNQRNENYKLNGECVSESDQFRREDRNYQERGNNQFNQQKMNLNNDRFVSGNDRFGPGNNRFGITNDRFGSGNDRFGMPDDRFGSGDNRFIAGNDRFGGDRIGGQGSESLNDRFGPNNDRFGPNNEPYGPGGDRFNRNNIDRFEQKDVGDNRRDNFQNASRSFNRNNNQFESPPDKFALELKKLMEKRRAAIDIFKPSYLDSDKSSNVGSLSESFKKITGDSPFIKSTGNQNFGPRGPSNFGPSGQGNFRMAGDFKFQGNPEFGSRGTTGIGRNNSFDSRDASTGITSFRGPNFSPQQVQDFINTESRSNMTNLETDTNTNNENKTESITVTEHTEINNSKSSDQNVDNTQKEDTENHSVQKDILLLEKPPWVDSQLSEDNLLQKDSIKKEEISSGKYDSSEQNLQNTFKEQTEVKQELSNKDGNDDNEKKAEVLPFMGENDPKPEDLNMEPPPELPNLGPISTNELNNDSLQRTDESYETKESSSKSFPNNNNPECFDPRGPFVSTFGPRGMQFRLNAPFLSPKSPNDVRFPIFEPFNSSGPNLYPLGSRGSSDGQFGPRGSNNGQFAPRGPDGQFGPRNGNDGIFGSKGSNDGLFGPRVDNQLGLKPPNNGQFGPRSSNIGQFGPRYDGQLDLRRSNDGQFGLQGLNNRPFVPGRSNDPLFDNRSPCDLQFTPRGPSEGQIRFSGSNDRLFGSRRNDSSYQRSPNNSKVINDGLFPNRFNEKQFDNSTDGCFVVRSSNDTYLNVRGPLNNSNDNSFQSRGQGDRFFDNRQVDVRGIEEIRSKRSLDNNTDSKIHGSSEVSGGGTFDNNEKISIDENMQQGKFDSNDMQNPGWRQIYSKNSFGDIDQRSGRGYSDKSLLGQNETFNQNIANNIERRSPSGGNKCNIPDRRLERGMTDMTVGDYKTLLDSDYTKLDNTDTYLKRSVDNRQSQIRCSTVKEFYIEKQFNYNHGGAGGEKKFIEHIPAKIIDYAHTSRSSIQDHLTPVQCFDYGHGNLKPLVPENEMQPKKDFRNWEENEQNLKEYTERIKNYEYHAGKIEFSRLQGDYKQRRNSEEFIDDRKFEKGERKEKEEYKGKEREDRILFDHTKSDKDQDNRYDKNSTKGNLILNVKNNMFLSIVTTNIMVLKLYIKVDQIYKKFVFKENVFVFMRIQLLNYIS